jgi:hypothetical protein
VKSWEQQWPGKEAYKAGSGTTLARHARHLGDGKRRKERLRFSIGNREEVKHKSFLCKKSCA